MAVDHLEELFKNGADNMDEIPPKASWEKLNQKLEHHKTRKTMARVQKMAIAASVLALISISIVSVLFLRSQQNTTQLMAEKAYSSTMQELNVENAIEEGIYTVENVKTMNDFLTKNLPSIN